MIAGGRRNGKTAAQRQFIRHVLLTEGHLHVAATDGLWCVSATDIGPLWRKLRQPCPDKRPAGGQPLRTATTRRYLRQITRLAAAQGRGA